MKNTWKNFTADVTGNFVFGKNIEFFADYIEKEHIDALTGRDWKGKEFKNRLTLSEGSEEIENPLPIVSALIKNYLKITKEYEEQLNSVENPEEVYLGLIFMSTILELNLNYKHTKELQWMNPHLITNKDYLVKNGLFDAKEIAFPLILEIQNLYETAVTIYKQNFRLSQEFYQINEEIIITFKPYIEYMNLQLMNPKYIMEQRIKELDFIPIATEESEHISYSLGCEPKAGLLSLAWAELYFAGMYEMPVSICTYCGNGYRLVNNFTKNTCDNPECKAQSRRERDMLNRLRNAEEQKEKSRIRQQRSRDKKKVIELKSEGKSNQQILDIINDNAKKRNDPSGKRTIEDIRTWIKENKKS